MTDMTEYRAAALDDLAQNDPTEVELGETKVLLVRQGDDVHAMAATCPHKGVPLKNGAIDGDRIVCPAHRASFGLATGELIAPPACEALATYPVRIDDGEIFVTVAEGVEPHPLPEHARRGDDDRKFVIIGSGAAGWRAAETLRREGFEGSIIVVTDEGGSPFDRTGFSKAYIGSEDTPDAPLVRKPSNIGDFDIEIRQGKAIALDPRDRAVTLEGQSEVLRYDKLLVATGSGAREAGLPGGDLEGIHRIRTKTDADTLRDDIAARKDGGTCRVAIVGGGFIGLEAATFLGRRDGVEVTMIIREHVPLASKFGAAFGTRILSEQKEAGVTMLTGATVERFRGETRVSGVELENGEVVDCDIAIVAIGADPRTEWLPFTKDDDGGISVEPTLSVPDHPDVFLAGDIACVPTAWGPKRIEHWRFAQELGELAARNMLGQGGRYEGTPFFWTMQQAKGSYTYTGNASDWDRIDGTPDGGKFALSFVKDGEVPAVLALGFDDRVTLMERKMAGTGPVPEADAVAYGPD
ncbi:FAD-dependent oxidoreductase [Palleronia sp. LCG004]|uniref:FAD-dependent oxidoreductase n=1 Tax=Palleronia sp. LCG004 TaxID=3079304 RepID=UPI002941F968|nr:FAD-dependent oxidoreductase [Palleronia sp. LCG004]WOI56490.1 FAD-dependent oxidoreductase [Palleronia sp. LCG004]